MPANYTSRNGLRHRQPGQPAGRVDIRAGVGDQTGDPDLAQRGVAAPARRISTQTETAVTNSDNRGLLRSTTTTRTGSFEALRTYAA